MVNGSCGDRRKPLVLPLSPDHHSPAASKAARRIDLPMPLGKLLTSYFTQTCACKLSTAPGGQRRGERRPRDRQHIVVSGVVEWRVHVAHGDAEQVGLVRDIDPDESGARRTGEDQRRTNTGRSRNALYVDIKSA
ncbi:MAG: hypothetical protein ACYTF4_17715 [Planctomycetota bacterium]|jgi:hypothetical protein